MLSWPYEVLENVAAFVADDGDTLDALVAVFLVARPIHDSLLGAPARGIPANNALLARLFDTWFDKQAALRRIGKFTSQILAEEVKKRRRTFRRIRNNVYSAEHIIEDLWLVYFMLLEDDGKNMRQLERAGVERWAKSIFVSSTEQFSEGGWPVENELVKLTVAILSIVCDRASVAREPLQTRGELLVALHPFLVAAHRYPVAHLPDTRSWVGPTHPLPDAVNNTLLTLAMTVHEPTTVTHMGHVLTMSAPPVADGAICSVVMRNERQDSWYRRDIPLNRAQADAEQFNWATQADWQESNLLRAQGLGVEVPRADSEHANLALLEDPLVGSERWDATFWRLVYAHRALDPDPAMDHHISVSWFGTVYRPGMFTGKWVGRYVMHDWRGYTRMLAMHPASLDVVADTLLDEELGQYFQPMQFDLREHIATDIVQYVSTGEEELGDGVQNGWFPPQLDLSKGWGMREGTNDLMIRDPREPEEQWAVKRYKTWHPGMVLPTPAPPRAFPLAAAETPADVEMDFATEFDEAMEETPNIDVIITGETDYDHGKAWGAYKLYGRVRRNDALVVLVRAPQDQDPNLGLGRWIFRGYPRAGNALVGRWRETGTDMSAAPYEGAFVLCKVGEAWGIPPAPTPSA